MIVWAIVPIKPLNRAKSRLSSVLTAEQREKLALGMLRYNLEVLTASAHLSGIIVISRDMKALAVAREMGSVQTLQESGTPALNNALQRASQLLMAWGAQATLMLPADVPLITPADVEAIIQRGHEYKSIVITPDRFASGTNAILTHPPDAIELQFGVGSFEQHQYNAREAGVTIHIYESERISLDVDTPDDLEHYAQLCARYDLPMIDYT